MTKRTAFHPYQREWRAILRQRQRHLPPTSCVSYFDGFSYVVLVGTMSIALDRSLTIEPSSIRNCQQLLYPMLDVCGFESPVGRISAFRCFAGAGK